VTGLNAETAARDFAGEIAGLVGAIAEPNECAIELMNEQTLRCCPPR